jgi:hypothetical protein
MTKQSEASRFGPACSICGDSSCEIHYAIRDTILYETYSKWLWRHIVCLLTFGLKRNRAVILPVCDNCANSRMKKNIAS